MNKGRNTYFPAEEMNKDNLDMLTALIHSDVKVYHIVTALRGPDTPNDASVETFNGRFVVKYITTAVIRNLMGIKVGNPAGAVSTTMADAKRFFGTLRGEQVQQAKDFWANNLHFRSHLEFAFKVLAQSNPEVAEYWSWMLATLADFRQVLCLAANYRD